MWDGKSHDDIRYLRIAIKNDEQHLANAPLGLIQKSRLKKQIAHQKARLKELNRKKREQNRKGKTMGREERKDEGKECKFLEIKTTFRPDVASPEFLAAVKESDKERGVKPLPVQPKDIHITRTAKEVLEEEFTAE